MPYSQEISRDNPGAFLFLIDQSRSMNKAFTRDVTGEVLRRAVYVADAVNKTLEELVSRCLRDDGVRDYFEIGIIGYGRTGKPNFCWEEGLAGRTMVPVSEVSDNARLEETEIEMEVRGEVVKETVSKSIWVKPAAIESTPMKAALMLAHATLDQWVKAHQNSFPPIVINITDGMANDVESDEELIQTARNMCKLKTNDGNVLLFNCHIDADGKQPVVFPSSPDELPEDPYAKVLFQMSSEMSDRQRSVICEIFEREPGDTPSIRGMAYNADAVALVKLLDIGTRQAITIPVDDGGDDMDDELGDDDDLLLDDDDDWADYE